MISETEFQRRSKKLSTYRKQIKQMQGALAKWKARAMKLELEMAKEAHLATVRDLHDPRIKEEKIS